MEARRIPWSAAAPLAGGVVVLAVLVPFVLRQNAWYEWGNALWLVERQAEALRESGRPSWFLHTPETGVFYPQFAFYGGALFAATGALAVAVGSAWWAFVGVLAAAALCAFGSVLWIGRQAGLGWGLATLAAVVVGTSPYSVATLYGRGAWTEIVATSAVPLALAGGMSLMRARRPWRGALALGGAAAIVGGSHNVTVVWGAIACAVIGAAALWALPARARRRLSWRRAAMGACALALGAALVAWSLLPSALYGRGTRAYDEAPGFLDRLGALDSLGVVLRPYPYVPPELAADNPAARFQLPVYALAWALAVVAVAVAGGRGSRTARRLALALTAVLAVFVGLLVAGPAWHRLPAILTSIQFPLRLHAYAALVVALLVVAGLALTRDLPGRRWWVGGLLAAVGAQAVTAQLSAWDAPSAVGRGDITAGALPPAFSTYQRVMYRGVAGTPVARPARALDVPAAAVRDDRVRVDPPPGPAAFQTNVVASPLVSVDAPWRVAGRDAGGLQVVVAAPRSGGAVVVRASPRFALTLAGTLSLASLAVAMAGGALLAGRAWRTRVPGR